MNHNRIFNYVLIFSFLGGITLPLVFTHTKETSQIEKRSLAPIPSFSLNIQSVKKFPEEFDNFYSDHFGFREKLVYFYSLLSVAFGVSPSERVMLGREGWLFLNHRSGVSIVYDDYRNARLFTTTELEQWKKHLEMKYNWLKSQGIDYIFVVAPNKHSIYGEYLPSHIRKLAHQSRYDQLIKYMRQDSEVPIIDLRPSLLRSKKNGYFLYKKTDTHWNVLGANFAQYEIASYLTKKQPIIRPRLYRMDDLIVNTEVGGDLAHMMNLKNQFKEDLPALKIPPMICERQDRSEELKRFYLTKFSLGSLRESGVPKMLASALKPLKYQEFVNESEFLQAVELQIGKEQTLKYQELILQYSLRYFGDIRSLHFTDCLKNHNTNALIFGDSFFVELEPYISQYFKKTTYVGAWNRFDLETMEYFVQKANPDVVIEEKVERSLQTIVLNE